MPQWLKPIRLSFWPAMKFAGLTGLTAIPSSACRRKVQSWFTRTLPSVFRLRHPSALALIESEPAPLPAPARSSASDAACSKPDERNGAVFVTEPDLIVEALSSPSAALLMWLSLAKVVIGVLTNRMTARAMNPMTARIRLLIAPPPRTTDLRLQQEIIPAAEAGVNSRIRSRQANAWPG